MYEVGWGVFLIDGIGACVSLNEWGVGMSLNERGRCGRLPLRTGWVWVSLLMSGVNVVVSLHERARCGCLPSVNGVGVEVFFSERGRCGVFLSERGRCGVFFSERGRCGVFLS